MDNDITWCLNNQVFMQLDNFEISPAANTDNMGKLFVTVFAFAPAHKRNQ
jgi:hypothetical protein